MLNQLPSVSSWTGTDGIRKPRVWPLRVFHARAQPMDYSGEVPLQPMAFDISERSRIDAGNKGKRSAYLNPSLWNTVRTRRNASLQTQNCSGKRVNIRFVRWRRR